MRPSEVRAALEAALGATYHIEREVRPAGSCRRFVALELPAGSEVLVKVLPTEIARAVDAERLEREVLLVGPRLRHPRIVPPTGAGAAGPFLYYLRPFVRGSTLRARLAKFGALPLHQAVRILAYVLEALAHAHGETVPHGDLQPDNVLLDDGRARVAEFGLVAALVSSAARGRGAGLGLALTDQSYVSPERRAGDGRPHRLDDLYAVGTLAYHMLTGEPPTPAAGPPGTQAPEPVRRRRDSLPIPLGDVIMRCLAPDPAARPQAAAEILEELSRLTAG